GPYPNTQEDKEIDGNNRNGHIVRHFQSCPLNVRPQYSSRMITTRVTPPTVKTVISGNPNILSF
ncbi:MAG: hypothetical protein WB404_10540, partial [Methanoregula sp.]